MKICLIVLFLGNLSNICSAQSDTSVLHFRDIVVTMDTTIEYNNFQKGDNIKNEFVLTRGLRLSLIDNQFRLFYFNEYNKAVLNGVHMEFYMPSNMPKVKGMYVDDKKNGEWFYWSEKGVLQRKEVWKMGVRVKTITH